MIPTSPSLRKDISGATHAVYAACLSAVVMIIILLSPSVGSAISGSEIFSEYQQPAIEFDQTEYASTTGQIAGSN